MRALSWQPPPLHSALLRCPQQPIIESVAPTRIEHTVETPLPWQQQNHMTTIQHSMVTLGPLVMSQAINNPTFPKLT